MTAVKQKSMKLNMALNAVRGLLGIIFPLISFPYVSKILGVDNIGKYNFALSIVSYFTLFSGLGISTYAVREGSRIRNDTGRFQKFANEMFTINIIFTFIAYLLLAIMLFTVPKFYGYLSLIIILSLQIIFKTVGIEWLYSIYEDYAYITIRSIMFYIISIVMLFVFVKTSEDLLIYAGITVFSSAGSNVLNYIYARKYCKIGLNRKVSWKQHMKPILILFAMALTITIYVSSDTTILGFLCDDKIVGIYSVSTKVYSIVKTILASVLVVSIPRISAALGKNELKEFSEIATDIYSTLLTVALPAIVGIIILRKEIILIISNNNYIKAVSSLVILSIALFFCLGAWFWGQCILVPLKKEMVVFEVTIVSALVNIVLNFVMIPFWNENAAALTTMLAEGISFVWCSLKGKKYVKTIGIGSIIIKIIVGCSAIILISFFLKPLKKYIYMYTMIMIIVSVIIYFLIEIILKNDAVYGILKTVRRKFTQILP